MEISFFTRPLPRTTGIKPDGLFYTAAGAIFLAHSSAILVWYVLFFVQSLLISTQNRRLHRKLG